MSETILEMEVQLKEYRRTVNLVWEALGSDICKATPRKHISEWVQALQSQLAALKLENERLQKEVKSAFAECHDQRERKLVALEANAKLVELVGKMPAIKKQRPYDDDKPDGYLESFRDRSENNRLAVEWFLENGDALCAEIERVKGTNPPNHF